MPLCVAQATALAFHSSPDCPPIPGGVIKQVCVPCYSPIDGSDTGACRLKAGDAPTSASGTVFPGCLTARTDSTHGKCVPALPYTSRILSGVQQHGCPAGRLCMPESFVNDPWSCGASCTTNFPAPSDAGACIARFVIEDNAGAVVAASLSQSSCAAGELCTPCVNPLSGTVSGACDPFACRTDAHCASTHPHCRRETGRCACQTNAECTSTGGTLTTCKADSGECVECVSGPECTDPAKPHCSGNKCVECLIDAHCSSGQCDTAVQRCTCNGDADCAGTSTQVCGMSIGVPYCVQCLDSSDCPGPAGTCASNVCIP